MGSKDLRKRKIWQDYSGENALQAEKDFYSTFQNHFLGSDYDIRSKPKEFSDVYVHFPLDEEVLSAIYQPKDQIKKHGISPDYAIDNLLTGKKLYVEVKRQDGWVEGGQRKDGRGNAHERSCKFFTPGLISLLRDKGGIKNFESLPFWVVFIGNITRYPCRVREVSFWYQGFEDHFFMWRNQSDPNQLLQHFNNKLSKLLE